MHLARVTLRKTRSVPGNVHVVRRVMHAATFVNNTSNMWSCNLAVGRFDDLWVRAICFLSLLVVAATIQFFSAALVGSFTLRPQFFHSQHCRASVCSCVCLCRGKFMRCMQRVWAWSTRDHRRWPVQQTSANQEIAADAPFARVMQPTQPESLATNRSFEAARKCQHRR